MSFLTPKPAHQSSLTHGCYIALISCIFLLIGTFIIDYQDASIFWFRMLVVSIPLLLPLPGVIAVRHRSASLISFIILVYFCANVVKLGMIGFQLLPTLQLLLVLIIFVSSMFYSRWRQRELVAMAQNQVPVQPKDQ